MTFKTTLNDTDDDSICGISNMNYMKRLKTPLCNLRDFDLYDNFWERIEYDITWLKRSPEDKKIIVWICQRSYFARLWQIRKVVHSILRTLAFYTPWRHAWFINGARCGLCGRLQCDFHVPDDVWLQMNKLRGRTTSGGVLCANCYLLICQYGGISNHKIETLG